MARLGAEQVTVFGGSGFVGTQVVRALARRGYRIRVAVRRPHLAGHLRPLGDVGQIHILRSDVTDADQVAQALAGSTGVVNLVGILHESASRRFQALQAEAPGVIARTARDLGIAHMVQVSAIGADARSAAAYARSKARGEEAARAALPGTVVIRPSVVFGAGDGFLNRFAQMAGLAPALPLVGGGKTRFQPVYVSDVAEAVARTLFDPAAQGRTYELGGPRTYSFREILEYILTQTGQARALVPLPFAVAGLIGSAGDVMGFFGLTPPLTSDQVEMLKRDNVVSEGAAGLAELGITPTGMEAIAPSYLWRYRRGGQFAEAPVA